MSLMRWVGSKRRYIRRIDAALPERITGYYEPFVGGGSILTHVLKSGKLADGAPVCVNDANASLICFYETVKISPEALINELRVLDPSKECYYGYRVEFNDAPMGIRKAALFLYLNMVGFRGLFRTNSAGRFNAPYGSNTFDMQSRPFFSEHEIRTCSLLYNAHRVEFTASGFGEFLQHTSDSMPQGSVVVADPPYVSLKPATFSGYTPDKFSHTQSKQVVKWMHSLRDAGHAVIYFNHDVAAVRAAYKGWTIERYTARRSIRPTNAGATAEEVMIYTV